MAPKRSSQSTTPAAQRSQPLPPQPQPQLQHQHHSPPAQSAQAILLQLWSTYVHRTPHRVKQIDVFLGFLVALGVLQFVYCVVGGNYVRLLFFFVCVCVCVGGCVGEGGFFFML
jgi:oligosaccharyltransferase complex subunit epsilon